jgi:predicted MPP superfamily phosphohydrolase
MFNNIRPKNGALPPDNPEPTPPLTDYFSELQSVAGGGTGARSEKENCGNSRPFARTIIPRALREQMSRLVESIQSSENVAHITRALRLYRFEVPVSHLPEQFDNFTILQLSDFHLNCRKSDTQESLTALANYLKKNRLICDLVVITGDTVNRSGMDFTVAAVDSLRRIGGEARKLWVIGNHDYYCGLEDVTRGMMRAAGYQELCNEWAELERDGARIFVYGTDDASRGNPLPPRAIPGERDSFRLILTHNLDALTRDFPNVFSLALSGHVHSGEIGFAGLNGSALLRLTGHWKNRNRQQVGWKALTSKCLSYVSPGMSRHVGDWGTTAPGASLLVLRGDKAKNDFF